MMTVITGDIFLICPRVILIRVFSLCMLWNCEIFGLIVKNNSFVSM